MALSDYPKATNSLLTQDEKRFLDDIPDNVVAAFLSEFEGKQKATLTYVFDEGVTQAVFESAERIQAVVDYYDMLFEYGVRERPSND